LEEDDPPPLDVAPEGDVAPTFGPTMRRSARTGRPAEQYQQYMEQQNMDFTVDLLESEEADEMYHDALHGDDYRIQDEMKDHVAFMPPPMRTECIATRP
jgi:hypothetical protein